MSDLTAIRAMRDKARHEMTEDSYRYDTVICSEALDEMFKCSGKKVTEASLREIALGLDDAISRGVLDGISIFSCTVLDRYEQVAASEEEVPCRAARSGQRQFRYLANAGSHVDATEDHGRAG